jgi:hypothetical protein
MPLGPGEAQRLVVLDKDGSGEVSLRESIPVRFSRLETVL